MAMEAKHWSGMSQAHRRVGISLFHSDRGPGGMSMPPPLGPHVDMRKPAHLIPNQLIGLSIAAASKEPLLQMDGQRKVEAALLRPCGATRACVVVVLALIFVH